METESKIGKLGKLGEISRGRDEWWIIDALNNIIEKQGEIIDHLNSQAQPEEKKTLEQIREEFDKERVKEWDRTAMETYKQATQDTPEQKEEWGKELGKLMSTWGKVLFVNKGRIGVGMQTAMYLEFYHFIKNLLSEREVFTKDELFMLKLATNDIHNKGNGAYDEIGEKIERMLSKLNK